jgi:hypothetical protein
MFLTIRSEATCWPRSLAQTRRLVSTFARLTARVA